MRGPLHMPMAATFAFCVGGAVLFGSVPSAMALEPTPPEAGYQIPAFDDDAIKVLRGDPSLAVVVAVDINGNVQRFAGAATGGLGEVLKSPVELKELNAHFKVQDILWLEGSVCGLEALGGDHFILYGNKNDCVR